MQRKSVFRTTGYPHFRLRKSCPEVNVLVVVTTTIESKVSHHIFVHPTKSDYIIAPHIKPDLGKGLVHKLLKQAGLK